MDKFESCAAGGEGVKEFEDGDGLVADLRANAVAAYDKDRELGLSHFLLVDGDEMSNVFEGVRERGQGG